MNQIFVFVLCVLFAKPNSAYILPRSTSYPLSSSSSSLQSTPPTPSTSTPSKRSLRMKEKRELKQLKKTPPVAKAKLEVLFLLSQKYTAPIPIPTPTPGDILADIKILQKTSSLHPSIKTMAVAKSALKSLISYVLLQSSNSNISLLSILSCTALSLESDFATTTYLLLEKRRNLLLLPASPPPPPLP